MTTLPASHKHGTVGNQIGLQLLLRTSSFCLIVRTCCCILSPKLRCGTQQDYYQQSLILNFIFKPYYGNRKHKTPTDKYTKTRHTNNHNKHINKANQQSPVNKQQATHNQHNHRRPHNNQQQSTNNRPHDNQQQ